VDEVFGFSADMRCYRTGVVERLGKEDTLDGAADVRDLLAGDKVLPCQQGAVLEFGGKVQGFLEERLDDAPDAHHAGIRIQNRIDIGAAVEVAAGQDEIADTCSPQVEV